MPANLTPDYIKAEEKYKNAKTPQEKLEALHEMLATIPKHKGTEKMQADIKRRIAKLTDSSGKKGAKRTDFYFVPKEGAGQVVLAGPPNSGKSSLLKKLTNAHPVIGEYPFSTTTPVWGMIFFENIQIQLVDIPPVSPEFHEGWVFGIIRNADLVIVVVDIADDDSMDKITFFFDALNQHKIFPVPESVKETEDPAAKELKTIIAANKSDIGNFSENLELLKLTECKNFETFLTSSSESWDDKELKNQIFNKLDIIRIYTKQPGKEADKSDPVILHKGANLMDFAKAIHKDFAKNLKFARIWGDEVYPGQKVQHDFELRDEDIIELHIK
ncbi:MAG: TGS domain-containing protein [bacterium]|nr:TGS domain-containing protein [bacterium]